MDALVPVPATAAFEAASTELFTAHNTGAEAVALVNDPRLPWVVRKGGKLPTILEPHYQTQAEAECAALGLNHAAELTRAGRPSWPRLRSPRRRRAYRGE